MSESIHGHEVMQMMIEAKVSYTKESLEKAMIEKYGPDARFHTCSLQDATAKELIEFLESREKFVGTDQGFQTQQEKICDH